MTDADFARRLLAAAMQGGRSRRRDGARWSGRPIRSDAPPPPRRDLASLPAKLPEREQSNSNVVFGDQLILKLYRRLGEGINPELEIGEHLTKVGFTNTAPLAGAVEVVGRGGRADAGGRADVRPQPGGRLGAFLDHGQRYFERLDALTAEQAASLCLPGDPGCARRRRGPAAGRRAR